MATFNFNKANLAAAQIPASITSSQTSITVDSGDAATFPTPPFFATIMPAGGVPNTLNSEIVQVTAVNTSTGVLTITRAQRGSTAKQQDEGAVIMNGVYIEDLAQSQAVGKSFFSATLSSSVYYIQDARLTTTPENGDSIRVVFGSNWTSGTPKLSLNSGTSYNIYAGNNLTASHGTTTTPAMVKSGVIYELTYYNGAWYILNLVGNSSITSDNVDLTTLKSTGTSIAITAGTWLVTHKVSVGQQNISGSIILIYTLTGFPSQTTIAGKCDAQNLWQTATESAIITVSSSTTLRRTNSTSSNAETCDEYWTATRIK